MSGKIGSVPAMNLILNDLTIDTESRTLYQNGTRVTLPDLSFDVLVAILSASPSPVTTDKLTQEVWRSRHVSDDTISQRIKLVRKALGDNSKTPRYIRTVRGVGYSALGKVERRPREEPLQQNTPAKFRLYLVAFVCCLAGLLVYAGIGSTPESDKRLVAAPSQQPDSHIDVVIKRARQQLSLHQTKETQRAIDMLRQVLQEQPEHYQGRLSLSFALSTKTTKFGGSYEEEQEAESLARQLIDELPDDSAVWTALGYALSSQGRSDEALAAFRQGMLIDPNNTSALSSAGHILLLKGDFQQSLRLEARVLATGNVSRYSEIQITQILQLIGHQGAGNWLARALSSNPGQAVVIAEAARFYIRQGQPGKALSVLEDYSEDDTSAPQLAQLKGRTLGILGHWKEAKASLQNAGWRGHALLTAIHAKEGDSSLFERFFPEEKRQLLATETDAELHIQMAEVYAAMDQQQRAFGEISEAINLGWRDIDWLVHSPFLGPFMQTQLGDTVKARISRELEAQRTLINQTPELSIILNPV